MLIGIVSVAMPLPILRPRAAVPTNRAKQARRGADVSEPAQVSKWLLEVSDLQIRYHSSSES
jgi:hypothetical protein